MNVVVEPKYDMIKSFENGYARVKNGGRWGIIDKTGKVVVEIIYDEVGNFHKNTTWVKNGTAFGLVIAGKFKAVEGAEKIWDFHSQDFTYAKKNGKIGFIDLKGNWAIEPKFDKARAFSKNLAPVCVGSKWGYINTKGTIVIEPQFKDAEIFSENGLAPIKEKNWGFINESGKLVIPTQYGITTNAIIAMFIQQDKGFIDGVARVKNEGKWGFLKPDGTVLSNQWFENAELFSNSKTSEKTQSAETPAEKPKQEAKQTIRDEKKLHTEDTINYYFNAESVEEKWRLLNNAISNYGFKQDEKDYILTNALNQDFIYKFMEVHIYLQYDGQFHSLQGCMLHSDFQSYLLRLNPIPTISSLNELIALNQRFASLAQSRFAQTTGAH